MTITTLAKINEHYASMFGNGMSQRTLQMLSPIRNVDQLEHIRDELSDGAFDAAEAILRGL